MYFGKLNRFTIGMIYTGTLLLSILSFFTTLKGLAIVVSWPLAIIGSLGLQTAMLGIAWNIMRIKENRSSYIIVFGAAAVFSVFFSYANFDINLKSNTRPFEAREAYNKAARPVLVQYASLSKKARSTAQYQVDRLKSLLELENQNGWATAVDEGSGDKFVQSIIDGARRTVASWEENQGGEYHQGSGAGIITNYLNSRQRQAASNLRAINKYDRLVESQGLMLKSDLNVERQFDLVNKAYVNFPSGVVELIFFDEPTATLTAPPSVASYVEEPVNSQQAFSIIMGDLYKMDRLAFFSLMLALAIDLIVILMALAGSYSVNGMNYLLERVEEDSERRLRDIPLDELPKFEAIVEENKRRLTTAVQYARDVRRIKRDNHDLKSAVVTSKENREGARRLKLNGIARNTVGRIKQHIRRGGVKIISGK